MIKKYLSLIAFTAYALTSSAQAGLRVSPTDDGNAIKSEALSSNRTYQVGLNSMTLQPVIWNTEKNDIVEITALVPVTYNEYDENDNLVNTWEEEEYGAGSLHAVTDEGVAVGEFGTAGATFAVKVLYEGNDGSKYTKLWSGTKDTASSAYDITADGNTIVGFYLNEFWSPVPCIWTNGGTERKDLPLPTAEQLGFRIDYAEARWISADGSIIGGYVQDWFNGKHVMTMWHRNDNGEYVADAPAAAFYESEYGKGKPYMLFDVSSSCLSKNGEWFLVMVEEEHGPDVWDTIAHAARYNTKSGELQILDMGDEPAPSFLGIANDGTAVGCTGSYESVFCNIIWYANSNNTATLDELFPEEELFAMAGQTELCSITPDGKYVAGTAEFLTPYGYDEGGEQEMAWSQSSFNIALPGAADGINSQTVTTKKSNTIYDLYGRKVGNVSAHGIYIINGKKIIK